MCRQWPILDSTFTTSARDYLEQVSQVDAAAASLKRFSEQIDSQRMATAAPMGSLWFRLELLGLRAPPADAFACGLVIWSGPCRG